MRNNPKQGELLFLNGKALEMVCYAAYSIYFHFEDKILVTAESTCDFVSQDGATREFTKFPIAESRLMRLIGCRVSDVNIDAAGSLALKFSDGSFLKFLKEAGPYEAYHIKHGNHELTV